MLQHCTPMATLSTSADLMLSQQNIPPGPALKAQEWLALPKLKGRIRIAELAVNSPFCESLKQCFVERVIQRFNPGFESALDRHGKAVGQFVVMHDGAPSTSSANERA